MFQNDGIVGKTPQWTALKAMAMPPTDIMVTESSMLSFTALAARSTCPAPRFCPTTAASGAKAHGGHEDHGVDLVADTKGGNGVLPKLRTKTFAIMKPRPVTDWPKPAGKPTLTILAINFRIKRRSLTLRRRPLSVKKSSHIPATVLKALAVTVAQAAPATPYRT